jgi:hypothetical protein
VKNLLAPGIAPGSTIHAGSGEQQPLWRAAQRYASHVRVEFEIRRITDFRAGRNY